MNQLKIQDIVVSRGGLSKAQTFAEERTTEALAALEKIASCEKNLNQLSQKALADLRLMPQFVMARKN